MLIIETAINMEAIISLLFLVEIGALILSYVHTKVEDRIRKMRKTWEMLKKLIK